jgi:hypothetical protein
VGFVDEKAVYIPYQARQSLTLTQLFPFQNGEPTKAEKRFFRGEVP